jgi:hypothetical protein
LLILYQWLLVWAARTKEDVEVSSCWWDEALAVMEHQEEIVPAMMGTNTQLNQRVD